MVVDGAGGGGAMREDSHCTYPRGQEMVPHGLGGNTVSSVEYHCLVKCGSSVGYSRT